MGETDFLQQGTVSALRPKLTLGQCSSLIWISTNPLTNVIAVGLDVTDVLISLDTKR